MPDCRGEGSWAIEWQIPQRGRWAVCHWPMPGRVVALRPFCCRGQAQRVPPLRGGVLADLPACIFLGLR